mmetsp:Transcript_24565/g.77763  ORF Transcript_24565/g.77763 Transcript_24565/m.77763 type:complete len:203 (-) Transcript_24565:828-1436(-)
MGGPPTATPPNGREGAHPDAHDLALLEARSVLHVLEDRLRGVEVRAYDPTEEGVPDGTAVQNVEIVSGRLTHCSPQERGQVLHVQRREDVKGDTLEDQELRNRRRGAEPATLLDPGRYHVPRGQAIRGDCLQKFVRRSLPDEPHGLRPVPRPTPVRGLVVHLVRGQRTPEEEQRLEGHVQQGRPGGGSKPGVVEARRVEAGK